MRKIMLSGLFFIFISCFKEPKKVEEKINPNTSVDTYSTKIDSSKQEQSKVKKFAYVIIKSRIPKIYNGERYKFSSEVKYTKEESTVYYCSLSFKDTIFASDILEIENYDKALENDLLLNYENKIKEILQQSDKWLKEIKLMECKNPQDKEEIRSKILESRIIDKQMFIYDSYSEATLNKEKEKKVAY